MNMRRTRPLVMALAGMAMAGGAAALTPIASADVFGQIGPGFGEPQTLGGPDSEAKFNRPFLLGSESDGGSVYVVDYKSATQYRLRKLSDAGVVQATTLIDAPGTAATQNKLQGLVVDSARDRLYLMQARNSADTQNDLPAAEKLLVYSTEEAGGQLPAPPDLPSGVLTLPSPVGAQRLVVPDTLAIDPRNGELLINAYDVSSSHVIVQRIAPDGTLGARFVDAQDKVDISRGLSGMAVGPDGTVFLGAGSVGFGFAAYRIPPTFNSLTVLPRATSLAPLPNPGAFPGLGAPLNTSYDAAELWSGVSGGARNGYGPQVAISADGDTLYWNQAITRAAGANVGNYVIASYSVSRSDFGSLYGGNAGSLTSCRLFAPSAGIVPLADGKLRVLDRESTISGTTYGDRVLTFGPGGSGCPAPAAAFKIGATENATVTVQKGSAVTFDASLSELRGATPTELSWKVTGPEEFTEPVTGSPAALTFTRTFTKKGTYTVGLSMKLTGSALGNPAPAATRTLIVVPGTPTAAFNAANRSPAAGANVTFDASTSVDPTGSETGTPSNALKSYRWDFGDGTAPVTTTEKTVTHAFANDGTAALARTVRLTVTSVDDVSSAAVSQVVTVQGKPGVDPTPTPTPTPTAAPVVTPTPTPSVSPSPRGTGALALAVAKNPPAGRALLTVSCGAGGGACSGNVTLTATVKVKKGKKTRAQKITVGTGTFDVAAGGRENVTIKLTSTAKKALKPGKKLSVNAAIELRDSTGAITRQTKKLTLTAAKSRS